MGCSDSRIEQQIAPEVSKDDFTIEGIPGTLPSDTKIVFVLGGPGSGKGTQCERIVKSYNFKHLSAGDLLRNEVKSGSAVGKVLDETMKQGGLVPVQVTITLLKNEMIKSGAHNFLIDGFPRALDQAQVFENMIKPCEAVLFFDCPEEVMEQRLLKRGETSGRSDDNIQTIKKRFRTFLDQSLPVVDRYAAEGKCYKISSVPHPDRVFEEVQKALDKKFKRSDDFVVPSVPGRLPSGAKIVFVLGGPGSGKGTQCERIITQYDFKHLSAGDLLRNEVKSGSATGKKLDAIMKEGGLVPVQVTITLLKNQMIMSGATNFLIDGFPRALDQAQVFEQMIKPCEFVLFFDCPEETMEHRLLKRGETSGRSDDNIATIKKRFRTFVEQSVPVCDYYAEQGKCYKIASVPPPDDVFVEVQAVLDQHFPARASMADFALNPHPKIPKAPGPVMVCILDGFGENEFKDKYNAVFSANTPVLDTLRSTTNRWRTVQAHGKAVGLPSDADMGNSEVGHNALGSGQVIDQGARLVDIALETGKMYELPGWQLISQAFSDNTVHFIGLLSDGGVHSRMNQLVGCMRGAAERGAKRIRCHVLTDGRDVPDGSSIQFVADLEKELADLASKGCDAKIASGGGRMKVTMDRYEADWEMVKRGWQAHVLGKAPHTFTDAVTAVKTLRGTEDKPISDQYVDPFVIVDEAGKPVGTVEDGDAVVLFNFRADRMVEISKALEYPDFHVFDRERYPQNLRFVGMMQYDGDLKLPKNFLVPPPEINHTSGEYLCKNGISTFACSETQKFGHVTFFWNGNRSGYFDQTLETYLEIPSDNCPFNEKPDMKAHEICEAGKAALRSGKYQMVRINFANPDMVGHTGDLAATMRACEVVDTCVGELLQVCDEVEARWLITSDHGNADDMAQRNKKGEPLTDAVHGKVLPLTSHTLAPVPVMVGGKGLPDSVVMRDDLPDAGLANITATYIELLGMEAPGIYKPSLLSA